jgi:hypothetical protein
LHVARASVAALPGPNGAGNRTTGVVDRVRSLPVLGSAVLVGHVLASVARNLVSTAVVVGVVLLLGFRPLASPLDWLGRGGAAGPADGRGVGAVGGVRAAGREPRGRGRAVLGAAVPAVRVERVVRRRAGA